MISMHEHFILLFSLVVTVLSAPSGLGQQMTVSTSDELALTISEGGAIESVSVEGQEFLASDPGAFYPVSVCDVARGEVALVDFEQQVRAILTLARRTLKAGEAEEWFAEVVPPKQVYAPGPINMDSWRGVPRPSVRHQWSPTPPDSQAPEIPAFLRRCGSMVVPSTVAA